MTSTDPLPALTRLLKSSLGDMLAPADSFPDMCDENVVFEAPYAPGGVNRLEGRKALADYLPFVSEHYDIRELAPTAMYRTDDPEVVVLEFESRDSKGAKTGRPYEQMYINVIRVRDGKIVFYRDYWNPIVALRSAGGEDELAAEILGTAP